jgi:hypothetical protein
LIQQEASQHAQVIEQAPAVVQVPLQFVEFELHQPQSLDPALGPGGLRHGGEVGFDFALGLDDRFKQKPHVLLGVLDSVERSLEGTTQGWKFLGK